MSQSRKHRKPIADTSRMGGNRLGPPETRLRSRLVRTPSGCLEYMGSRIQSGYGVITIDGKQTYTHRLAFELAHRPLEPGELVCHKCDNPPCCDPTHLFAGSIADNNRDMWAKGRGKLTAPTWRKIPPECLPAIIARFQRGETKQSIADSFGVTRQAIHHLLKREAVV